MNVFVYISSLNLGAVSIFGDVLHTHVCRSTPVYLKLPRKVAFSIEGNFSSFRIWENSILCCWLDQNWILLLL